MKKINPTDAELEVLQILWEENEARVKDVHEQMDRTRKVGYTTVLKTMQIMFEKGLLDRRQEGKGHVYYALVEKNEVQQNLLDKVLEKAYKGSTYSLVMSALGNHEISRGELEKIKELIKKQQEKNK